MRSLRRLSFGCKRRESRSGLTSLPQMRYLRSQITDRELKRALKDGAEDAMTWGEGEVELHPSDVALVQEEVAVMIETGWSIRWQAG